MNHEAPLEPPILTDIVELHATGRFRHPVMAATANGRYAAGLLTDEDIAALQAELVNRAARLTGELLGSAARDIEALLFERVLDRLRAALPELVAGALRQHLAAGPD